LTPDLTHRGAVTVLRMAHGKANALDLEFCEALTAQLDACERSPSTRALVIAGSGAMFSAGVDLLRVVDGGPDYVRVFLPAMNRMFERLFAFPKPVVAAVNGHAIAGGCIMVCAADWRLMTRDAGRIGIPELAVGVPFPALPLQIMAARVSDVALRDLIFTGRTVQVDDAKAMGLVDEKCPDGMLMNRAHEVARTYLAIPAHAFALTKAAFYTPILKRTEQRADVNARVVQEWMEPHTYETIRAYLARTVGKK